MSNDVEGPTSGNTDERRRWLQRGDLGSTDVDLIERRPLHKGFFSMSELHLRHRLFGGGWGPVITREMMDKPNAAAAIVYDPQRDLIGLVEQIRVGRIGQESSAWSLECVAGLFEGDESPEALLEKELLEEAGITHAALEFITRFYPIPGACTEWVALYCALCDLGGAEGLFGVEAEGEDIRFRVCEAELVFSEMLTGRTNNAITLVGLLWLQLHRPRLRQTAGGG